MKLPIFKLLPNEHFLSLLVRSYKLSGYSNFLHFQKKLGFQDRLLYTNRVFTPALRGMINHVEVREDLIKYHTIIPIWQISIGQIIENDNPQSWRFDHRHEASDFGFDTSWHSCKKCRQDDLDKYGTSYWHTLHQLQSVFECYKHGCTLDKGVEPIENLFKKVLPHQVTAWEPVLSKISKELRSWQSFVFKINKISHDQPTIVAGIRTQLQEVLGFNIPEDQYEPRKMEIYESFSQDFASFLGPELIRYIFRNDSFLTLEGGRHILVRIYLCFPICKTVRNPIYLIALAYWQRAYLRFD